MDGARREASNASGFPIKPRYSASSTHLLCAGIPRTFRAFPSFSAYGFLGYLSQVQLPRPLISAGPISVILWFSPMIFMEEPLQVVLLVIFPGLSVSMVTTGRSVSITFTL